MAVTGDAGGYALAFEEGKRAVAEQAATLKETRDRVGTILSAAAVAAGLAAGMAFNDIRLMRLSAVGVLGTVLAAVGFTCITVAAVFIWLPFRGRFTLDSGIIVGSYVEGSPPADLDEIHRELALHLGTYAAYNRDELEKRLRWFVVALAGLLLEIGGLMVTLADVAS